MTITLPDDLLVIQYARQTANKMFAAAHTIHPDNASARQAFYCHGIENLAVVPMIEIFFNLGPGDLTPSFAETVYLYQHSLGYYAANTYLMMELELVDPSRAHTARNTLQQIEETMRNVRWPMPDTQQSLEVEIKQVAPTLALPYHNGIFSAAVRNKPTEAKARILADADRYTVCKFAHLEIREFPPDLYLGLLHDVISYGQDELQRFDPEFETIFFEPRR